MPESFAANTPVEADVNTNLVAQKIKLTNENDKKIGTRVIARTTSGQQTTWNIEFSIGTPGSRILTFNAAKSDNVYLNENVYLVPVTVE